jgi:hypothetical protein
MSFEQPPRSENQESEPIQRLKMLLKEEDHALDEYLDFKRAGNIPAMERALAKAESFGQEVQQLLQKIGGQN